NIRQLQHKRPQLCLRQLLHFFKYGIGFHYGFTLRRRPGLSNPVYDS
ncbi:MAG: hypothetical protein ACI8QF_004573, partial [Limisphaerales bacterium]